MTEKSIFEQACADIKENLWILSPEARQRIIGWFAELARDGYERGVKVGLTYQQKKKICKMDEAVFLTEKWQQEKLKVGFTNGCFDLIHPGHIKLLTEARSHCDRLIVALNTDASVKRLKGETRPLQNETARAIVMAAMSAVDMVVLFDDDTPLEIIRKLCPDVLIKGSDYTIDKVVGAEFVQCYGGKVILVDLAEGHSTTNTISRMR